MRERAEPRNQFERANLTLNRSWTADKSVVLRLKYKNVSISTLLRNQEAYNDDTKTHNKYETNNDNNSNYHNNSSHLER